MEKLVLILALLQFVIIIVLSYKLLKASKESEAFKRELKIIKLSVQYSIENKTPISQVYTFIKRRLNGQEFNPEKASQETARIQAEFFPEG